MGFLFLFSLCREQKHHQNKHAKTDHSKIYEIYDSSFKFDKNTEKLT